MSLDHGQWFAARDNGELMMLMGDSMPRSTREAARHEAELRGLSQLMEIKSYIEELLVHGATIGDVKALNHMRAIMRHRRLMQEHKDAVRPL